MNEIENEVIPNPVTNNVENRQQRRLTEDKTPFNGNLAKWAERVRQNQKHN
jgi:hypothetical protein